MAAENKTTIKLRLVRDERYIADSDVLLVVRKNGVPSVLAHPNVPVSVCPTHPESGYFFQPRRSAPCCSGKNSRPKCLTATKFSAEEFLRAAPRYVRRCAVCSRIFVSAKGKGIRGREDEACFSPDCRLKWATENQFADLKCAICGRMVLDGSCAQDATAVKVRLSRLQNSPKIAKLDLYPTKRPFIGAEVAVCSAGDCREKYSAAAAEMMANECRAILKSSKLTLPPELRAMIEDRLAKTLKI